MYKVLIDNEILSWSNTEETALLSAILTLEANKAGTFVFSLAPNHPKYNAFVFRQSIIDVYQDSDLIFEGVPVSEETNFDNVKTVTCEGELTFLNDTIQRPAKYTGQTVTSFLTALLSEHNADCDASKTFTLGTVTVNGGSALYRYTNYESTMSEIAEDLVENLGGYLRVRHSGGVRYLDYLASSPHTSSQIIKIGYNLLDLSKNYSSVDICTMLIPLGATIDGQEAVQGIDKHVDITSVNGGLDYLTSTASATYGKIWRTVVWDGINDPSTLLSTATAYLTDAQWSNMVLEARAFDLGLARSDVEQFRLLDEIRVVSAPHGLDRYFLLTKLELNLNDPAQTMITLGEETFLPISAASAKTSAEVENQNTQMQVIATQHARDLLENATGGCVYFRYDPQGVLYEIDIMNTNDPQTATKMWRWNINGWGYSDDGGQTYTIAATMDGEIDANFIKTGTLDANVIGANSITLGKLASDVTNELDAIPVVNLLPQVYYYQAQYANPYAQYGVSFTANADGSVTVTGTNTSASNFATYYFNWQTTSAEPGLIPIDPTKQYIVSGCPAGGSDSTYRIRVSYRKKSPATFYSSNDTGSGAIIPTGYDYAYVRINIAAGYACPVGGLTFYPMLETGTVAHSFQRGTTVIDAGNILTGYINANRIDANSITLSKLASDVTTPITNAQTTADGAAYREQIIYKSVASGGSASATTTWVTTNTDTQNTWTTTRPTYASAYPVLYVAIQRQTMAQSSGTTCSCTTPQIDNTTTVIDGGHITTGTIDASVATITNINADNITTGALTIKNSSNVLLFEASKTSKSVTIGGFEVTSTSIRSGTYGTANSVLMCTGTTSSKSIGGSPTLTGWCFTADTKFGVTKAGAVYCSDAHIQGEVTATTGAIAGWTVSGNKISSNSGNTYISSDTSDYAFKATNTVIAHNGDIHTTGHLQMNGSGYIDLNNTSASIKSFGTPIIQPASTVLLDVGYKNKNHMTYYNSTNSDGVHLTINGTAYRLYYQSGYIRAAVVS